MDLSVTCHCGKKIAVSPALCGGETVCRCGTRVPVPKLSELRRTAGLEAFELGIADRLYAMGRDGQLPVENNCAGCGLRTTHEAACSVECQRVHLRRSGGLKLLPAALFMPGLLGLYSLLMAKHDDVVAEGNELVVRTPVRICPACFDDFRPSRRRSAQLLRTSELYAQLLDAYPQAVIHWHNKR